MSGSVYNAFFCEYQIGCEHFDEAVTCLLVGPQSSHELYPFYDVVNLVAHIPGKIPHVRQEYEGE